MTKAEECAALRTFRATLPPDTYLGAMLDHLIPQFVRDTTSDIYLLPDLGQIERDIETVRLQLVDLRKETDAQVSRNAELLQAAGRMRAQLSTMKDTARDLASTAARLANFQIP